MLRKIFKKKTIRLFWLIYALFSVVIVLYLANKMLCKDLDAVADKIYLDDGWDITINEAHYQNSNLKELKFSPVEKGDRITLKKTLPNDWKFEAAALCIHIRQTTVEMFVDEELVYEYGKERFEEKVTVGSGLQFINFPNEYKGKEIRMELQVTENHAFSSFDSMWISEWNNAYRFVITENRIPFFLGSFLLVFGIIVTLVSVFGVIFSNRFRSILYLAVFSICIGLWTLCYHNVVLVFAIPLYAISLVEYMTLTLAPIPLLAYMHSYVKMLGSRKWMIGYKALFITQFALTVITICLHTADIKHSAEMLLYFHILFAIEAVYFAYLLYKGVKMKKSRKKIYVVGLALLAFCILYELCHYISNRYLGIRIMEIRGMCSLGITGFIVILILDFFRDMTKKMMVEQEKELLIRRAYTDDLTQIHNRGYCSEYMTKLQNQEDSEYTIVAFDLNGLKQANDTYGHAKGDLLIKEAARVISDAFSENGVVGRMGGDEFIAILPLNDTKQIEAFIQSFLELVDEANQLTKDLYLSISYGYAVNKEVSEKNIEKVYQLADNRMYACKKQYKAQNE